MLIARSVILTSDYTPVSATPIVASVIVIASSANTEATYMRGDDGSDVPLPKGVAVPIGGVDLSTIELKGVVGGLVAIVGNTVTTLP